MTVLEDQHADHGATFSDIAGRRIVEGYGRPERTVRAVRNGVGVREMGYGIVELTGADRVDFVDNAVTNRVSPEEGRGCYALLLDPQGRIETDMYVFTGPDRLLVFVPPGRAEPLAAEWTEKTFIQDVEIEVVTETLAIFGVHGPAATEKVASVLHGAAAPEASLSFVRGSIADAGVTVVCGDGLAGEEGYDLVCAAADGPTVFEALVSLGTNAVPFGRQVWETLTLEAGTPLYESDLRDRIPNAAGIRNALDFEKGCYVGQEVVSRIENRGRPPERLIGLVPQQLPETGAAVFHGDEAVGEVTRAVESPTRTEPIAMTYVASVEPELSVRIDGEAVPAEPVELPFVDGSARSARVPSYP